MRLSEASQGERIQVVRDGEFHALGLLSHAENQMLVVLYDRRYLDVLLQNPAISCVITCPDLVSALPDRLGVVVSDDPTAAFYRIHSRLANHPGFYWSDFDTEISPQANVHPTAFVAARNVRIGAGTVVGPRAVILERTIVGRQAVIGPGVVLAGEGFEPKTVAGEKVIVPHAGGVRLGDRVEIQANSHIAKSVFGGCTEVGNDTKIDALVQIAHNVRIGCRCEIASGAVIAGSTTIGDDVWIGPSATVSSEIQVGDKAFVALGSVVTKNVAANQRVFGVPAKRILSLG
jgi:UDP-3-O-[3-hydroxymyristoyl] glucosamine N-acyltransferase